MDRRDSMDEDQRAGLRMGLSRRQHDDLHHSSWGACRRRGSGKEREISHKRKGYHMRTRLLAAVTGVVLLLGMTAPLWAHHAFAAEFDEKKPLKLKGTVVKWEVTNPHSWIHMDVKGPDGKAVTWMIEGGSPNNLYRLGFTKESLPF